MVNVKQLIESVKRIAWKAGTHEDVRHEIDADGNHRIVVTVPKAFAEWEAPQQLTGRTYFREHPDLTWDQIEPPPKQPKK